MSATAAQRQRTVKIATIIALLDQIEVVSEIQHGGDGVHYSRLAADRKDQLERIQKLACGARSICDGLEGADTK